MTTFSPAQYQAVIDKIGSGMTTVSQEKLPELKSSTSALLGQWYIPDSVKNTVKWLVDHIVHVAETILDKVEELLKGAAAPIYMFEYAWKWGDVKGAATGVAAEITTERVIPHDWTGPASDAYSSAITPQSEAAAQIGSISSSTVTSLTVSAAAGLAFYTALGVIIFQLITSLVTAIGLIGSGALSWAGLTMVVADAGVTSGMVIAAVTTLTALLGAQAAQMATLHSAVMDSTTFPGGRWPAATNM